MSDERPIGIFDSGVGGLTVLKAIVQALPNENLIYLGDTARVPYGDKSHDTVLQYAIENASFLEKFNIKALVIACNTASAYSLKELEKQFDFPIIGVIEPGAHQASTTSTKQKIAILGTRGTIRSGAYQKAIQCHISNAKIYPIECPLLAQLVEENFIHHPATQLIVRSYLAPIKSIEIDTLLLGCTHYPLLRKVFVNELGMAISIIDSATACAEEVKKLLRNNKIENLSHTRGTHTYYVSDDPEKFQKLGEVFLNDPITHVQKIRNSHHIFY